jgi:hypothetical protein
MVVRKPAPKSRYMTDDFYVPPEDGQALTPAGPLQIQQNRRFNVNALLSEFAKVQAFEELCLEAPKIGISRHVAANILRGVDVPDALAREIEWSLNLRRGWLDEWPHEPDGS